MNYNHTFSFIFKFDITKTKYLSIKDLSIDVSNESRRDYAPTIVI